MASLTLTPGADIATFGPEKSFVSGLVENLTAIDLITFGDGGVDDVLLLTSAGTVDFRTGGNAAGVTRFERLDLAAGANAVFLTDALVAASYVGVASAGFFSVRGNAGNDTVDASLVTGAGNRVQFVLGGGGDDIFLGSSGADVLRVQSSELTAADALNTGASVSDVLRFDSFGAVAVDGLANVRRVERIELNAGGNTLTLTQAMAASADGGRVTVFSGGGDNVVDASAATTAVQFFTGAGVDQYAGGSGIDTVVASPATLTGSDVLTGGSGAALDVLQLAGGSYTAAQFAGVSGFERVLLLAPNSTVNLAPFMAATSTGTFAVIGTAGNDTVDATGSTARVGFNPGSGTDRFTGGDGDDQINLSIADLDATDLIDGGVGRDRIGFLSAGTITAAQIAGLTSIETFSLASTGPNTVFLAANLPTVNVAGGSANDTVHMALSTQYASLGAGDDTMVVTASSMPGDSSYGKEGFDTIRTVGAGLFTVGPRIVEFEALVMQDAARLDLTASTMALSVTGSAGGDLVLLGPVGQVVDVADGFDVVVNGDGDDVLDGGAGFDVLVVAPGSTVDLTNTGPQDTGQGIDTIRNFELVIVAGGPIGQVIIGDDLPNRLEGGDGNDFIFGLGADDVLLGRGGNDRLDGGTGSDTAEYTAAAAGIVVNMGAAAPQVTNDGEGGQDTLVSIENISGSNLNDIIQGDANANVLEGNGGNDTLDGASGNDTASYANAAGNVTVLLTILGPQNTGAAGTDTLSNIENLTGGAFNDTLFGNALANILRGGAGNDYIQGGAGLDQLFGDAGRDTIEDPDGFALLRAGDDDDVANLSFGNATLTGTSNSWIQMGNGADQINFNFNNTVLQSTRGISTGSNTATSGASPDTVEANDGNDVVNINGSFTANGTYLLTMSGDDQVNANTTSAFGFVHLGAGNDQFNGGGGGETVYGGAGNDRIFAQGGHDLMDGGLGNDEMDGADGTDTVSYNATATSNQGGVRVDLAINTAQDTLGAGIDTIRNVENLTTTSFDDALFGTSGANVLNAGGGNDLLVGRLGADTLIGGAGDDRFRWLAANEGGDSVEKFVAGGTEDAFEFLASAFPLFHGQASIRIHVDNSAGGVIAGNANVVARSAAGLTTTAAVDAYLAGATNTFDGGVFVLANGGPGQIARLFYDADANSTGGAAAPVLLATLNGVTGVTGFAAADFLFV